MNLLEVVFSDPAFFIFSTVAIVGALGVIIEPSIIRAGFSLVISFGAVAGTYFALHAPFVGASQILIYAVGITLVIVFALMLTSLRHDMPKVKNEILRSVISGLIAFGIFFTFAFALTGNKWATKQIFTCPRNTEIIGLKLLGDYILPFELISVLLLVALIGAIVIAKKDKTRGESE